MKLANSLVVALAFLILTSSGCSGPDSVTAKKRTSKFKPVFAKEEAEGVRLNNVNLDFFHPDHFACLTLNVPNLVANQGMKDVPWDKLEEQFGEFVGNDNSSLKNINRIWVLLDRTGLEELTTAAADFGSSDGPWVFVMEFNDIPNPKQLDETIEKMKKQFVLNSGPGAVVDVDSKDTDSTNEQDKDQTGELSFEIVKIDDLRVAFGQPKLVAKVGKLKRSSELVRILESRKLDADFEAVLTITPMRSTLKSAFEMAAQFGGEAVEKFAVFPDLLERIDFRLSLESEEMFEALVHMGDPDLNQNIANAIREFSEMESPAMGGAGGSMFGGQKPPESPVPIKSTDLMNEVSQEIQDKKLFAVEADDTKVAFRLGRPAKFNELVSAMIQDGNRQSSFMTRTARVKKIASALRAYHEKHDSLPPAGVVKPNADSGLPPQFNWRVGLLPFLAEQEIYEKFDFEAAWDSAENKKIAAEMPDVFEFGITSKAGNTKTRLHVVGGSIGVYANESLSLDDIKDQKVKTALVIEAADSHEFECTQPDVLEFAEPAMENFGVKDEKAVLLVTAAFKVKAIRMTEENLRAVLTTDGDETLTSKSFFSLAK